MTELDLIERSLERANSDFGDELSDAYFSMIESATDPSFETDEEVRIGYFDMRQIIDDEEPYILAELQSNRFPDVSGDDLVLAFCGVLKELDDITRQQG